MQFLLDSILCKAILAICDIHPQHYQSNPIPNQTIPGFVFQWSTGTIPQLFVFELLFCRCREYHPSHQHRLYVWHAVYLLYHRSFRKSRNRQFSQKNPLQIALLPTLVPIYISRLPRNHIIYLTLNNIYSRYLSMTTIHQFLMLYLLFGSQGLFDSF